MALSHYYADSIALSADKSIYRLPEMYQTSLFHVVKKGYFAPRKVQRKNRRLADALLTRGRGNTPVTPLIKTSRWSDIDTIERSDAAAVNTEKGHTVSYIRRKKMKVENTTPEAAGTGDVLAWTDLTTAPEKRQEKIVMEWERRVLEQKRNARLTQIHMLHLRTGENILPSFAKSCPIGYRLLVRSTRDSNCQSTRINKPG